MTSQDNSYPSLVSLSDIRFSWPRGPLVLDLKNLELIQGERVFMRGPSGSGKSTLLGLIAGVLTPDEGEVRVLGETLSGMSGARRDAIRAAHIGVIFQLFNLLPYLSLIENVALPCRFSSMRRERALAASGSIEDEARRLLARLGLDGSDILKKPVRELSVGQQQRVAAARALIGGPELIIADEPTSALDDNMRDRFIALLAEEAEARGSTLLFVSHDAALAKRFTRQIDLAEINRVQLPELM
ncbi:MAG: ABC transporter ATP-binding protein [Pseudomonadota bacterium]